MEYVIESAALDVSNSSPFRRSRNGLLLGASVVSLLMLGGPVGAQSSQQLDTVTVGGASASSAQNLDTDSEDTASSEQTRRDAPYRTPAAVSSVSYSDLQTHGLIDTDDVVRAIPGTFTRESPSNPGVAINIRGFEGSGRVNTMIDGVRQNFRFTGHEAQGFAYVDPALLAGIDVQRGAVATTGGAGALAGSANLRTLGIDDIVRPGQSVGGLGRVTWGSNNVGWSEMVAAGARSGAFGLAGAVSKRDQGHYKNGDGVTVPFTDQDLISGLFKGEVRFSSEHKLNFGGVLYDNEFVANSYDQTVTNKTFTVNYAYNPVATDLVNLRINGYLTETDMEYGDQYTGSQTSTSGRVINDQGIGFDVSNTSVFSLGAVGVRSIYGYEYFKNDVDTHNLLAPSQGGGVNASGESEISGVFSETTFSYGIFDLIGALRYDHYKLDGTFTARPGNPMGVPVGLYVLDQDDGRLNPQVTFAAQVLPWLQPYVKYAEAFRAPTINETMAGGSHPGGGVGFSPNPFLEPEIQKGWEFGANVVTDGLFVRGDRFRLKADYYNQDIENYIAGRLVPQAVYVNIPGTSQVQGVEVEANYDAGYVFAGLGYTYTESDLPTQVNGFGSVSYLPDHVLTLTGGFRLLQERLAVGARGTFVSEAYNGADQAATLFAPGVSINGDPNDPYTDGYALLDLFANYTFDSGVELGVNVTNVFDVGYTPALSTPATGFSGETGRGRTALFTARAQF